MSDTSNAEAFVSAAQQIIDAATAPTPDQVPSAETQQAKVSNLLTALSNLLPQAEELAGLLAVPEAAATASVQAEAASDTCADGTPIPDVPPLGTIDPGAIVDVPAAGNILGLPVENIITNFLYNVASTVSAALAVFSDIGRVRAQSTLNWYQSKYLDVPLSPDILSDMVERNIIDETDAREEASYSGISAERFHDLVLASGEPPGIMQMVELYRRDLIGSDRLHQAIAESRVYTKYFCDILNLRYETMSAADAVEGFIKGVPITPDDFTAQGLTPPAGATAKELNNEYFAAMFRRGGGLPSQWDILKTAAGDALGVVKAVQLYDHINPATGKPYLSKEQVIAILGRSRINPIFYNEAFLYNIRWFSAFEIGSVVASDPGLAPQAIEWLVQDGYPRNQVTAYITAKAGGKVKSAKSETEAQVLQVYEAGTQDATWATTQLTNLGYTPAAINLILQAADNKRKLAYLNAAITHIRSSYVASHITQEEAITDLQALKVSAANAKEYVDLWTVERSSNHREISPATVGSLLKKGRIDQATAEARWEKMGYSAADAHLLYLDFEPTPASLKSNVPAP